MFEIGRLEPGPHGRDRTGFWLFGRHDDNRSPLPFLIRFRAAERYAQHSVFEGKIVHIERDDFRTAESARKSEEDDGFVPDRTQIETENLADRFDVFRPERPRPLLARAISPQNSVHRPLENGMLCVKIETGRPVRGSDRSQMPLRRFWLELSSFSASDPSQLRQIGAHIYRQ